MSRCAGGACRYGVEPEHHDLVCVIDMEHSVQADRRVMPRNTQHVVPHPEGGWSVKKGGASHATRRFDTQREAISFGRKISKSQGSELYIHGRDGMIRKKASYGNDPHPPEDAK